MTVPKVQAMQVLLYQVAGKTPATDTKPAMPPATNAPQKEKELAKLLGTAVSEGPLVSHKELARQQRDVLVKQQEVQKTIERPNLYRDSGNLAAILYGTNGKDKATKDDDKKDLSRKILGGTDAKDPGKNAFLNLFAEQDVDQSVRNQFVMGDGDLSRDLLRQAFL